MRLRWSPESLEDLLHLGDYLEGRNPQAAAQIMLRIETAINGLVDFPELGRPGRIDGTRELVITGTPYVVPYRIAGPWIDILHIYHGARKWPDGF